MNTQQTELYEAAYLAAGQDRAIDAAITSLVQREYLRVLDRRGRSLFRPETRMPASGFPLRKEDGHPLERAIVQAVHEYGSTDLDGQLAWIRKSVAQETDHIREHLRTFGLLVAEDQAKAAQRWRFAFKWFAKPAWQSPCLALRFWQALP